MREGWRTAKLGELSSLIARGVAPKYIDSGGVLVLNQKCIRDHRINYDLARRHDAAAKAVPSERFVRLGDVLVNSTGTGTLGRVAQVREAPPEPTTVDTHVTIVRPKPEIFAPDFFGYAMVLVEDEIALSGEGTSGQTELARSTLHNAFAVSFPTDIPEQQRIVAILDEAFAGLATATANAEKNLANARELFESRLNSIFDGRGDDWGTQSLENLCDDNRVITYGVIKLGNDQQDGVPCLRTSNVRRLHIDIAGIKKIAPALSQEYRRTILQGDEVLVNVRGTLGGVAVVSLDMVGWNVSREVAVVPINPNKIDPFYLAYFVATRGSQTWLTDVQKGVAYVGINIADLRSLPISVPERPVQAEIVQKLEAVALNVRRLEAIQNKVLGKIAALKQSILAKAFAGDLTASEVRSDARLATAEILCLAYYRHKVRNRERTLGHTKEQKILHMVEAVAGYDLGRNPIRDAAGPNDFNHMERAERWAEDHAYFKVTKSLDRNYQFQPLAKFAELLEQAKQIDQSMLARIETVIDTFIPMDAQESEVFATVYAAWNNLLIEGKNPTDEEIVCAAREDWHIKKLDIPRPKFLDSLQKVRQSGFIPEGKGRYVPPPLQAQLPL